MLIVLAINAQTSLNSPLNASLPRRRRITRVLFSVGVSVGVLDTNNRSVAVSSMAVLCVPVLNGAAGVSIAISMVAGLADLRDARQPGRTTGRHVHDYHLPDPNPRANNHNQPRHDLLFLPPRPKARALPAVRPRARAPRRPPRLRIVLRKRPRHVVHAAQAAAVERVLDAPHLRLLAAAVQRAPRVLQAARQAARWREVRAGQRREGGRGDGEEDERERRECRAAPAPGRRGVRGRRGAARARGEGGGFAVGGQAREALEDEAVEGGEDDGEAGEAGGDGEGEAVDHVVGVAGQNGEG